MLLIGIALTMIPTSLPGNPAGTLNLALFATMVVGGFLAAFAMSMDFPQINITLLSVKRLSISR